MTVSSCSVRFENVLTFSNSFNVMRTFCLPSHTFHTSLHMHDQLSQKHAHAMPTNPHMLVQSWRCARGIHCEYVHLVQNLFSLHGNHVAWLCNRKARCKRETKLIITLVVMIPYSGKLSREKTFANFSQGFIAIC